MSKIYFKSGHIRLSEETTSAIFGENNTALVWYDVKSKVLWVSDTENEFFKKLYKTQQTLLKICSPHGDKSISVRAYIDDMMEIDQAIELQCDLDVAMNILKIEMQTIIEN